MSLLIFLICIGLASVYAINPCPQYMWQRQNGCKTETVFRIPIVKYSESYIFSVNTTLDTIPNDRKNLNLSIENSDELLNNGTTHIVYVLSYPECNILPKIFKATLNGVDWCNDDKGNYRIILSATIRYNIRRNTQGTRLGDDSQPPDAQKCGIQKEIVPTVVRQKTINEGEFPWMAALYYFNKENNIHKFHCNANLISSKHIITSAMCVTYLTSDYVIVLGRATLINWAAAATIVPVNKINVHPQFKRHQSGHNLAIFTLTNPVAFNNKIIPICLWRGGNSENNIVTSWSSPYDIVNKTSMAIKSTEECSSSHAEIKRRVSENTFCAVAETDSFNCFGELGSGFMSEVAGTFYLRGVVSSGVKLNQCSINQYTIFADIYKNINWIDEIINNP